jgi:hypothetical protein
MESTPPSSADSDSQILNKGRKRRGRDSEGYDGGGRGAPRRDTHSSSVSDDVSAERDLVIGGDAPHEDGNFGADRAALKKLLEHADCPTDDRFIDGVEFGHMLHLGDFLAAHSLGAYRVALDVVQHDTPGNQFGHVLYRNNGALWVQEASSKLNFDDELIEFQLAVLDKAIETKNIETNHTGFWEAARKMRNNILACNPCGAKAILVARKRFRTDAFFLKNNVPTPETFFKLLNSQHHLLGFDNGVLDMVAFKFYPRGHVPLDAYVSFSCGYDFPGDEDGNPEDDAMREQMDQVEEHLAKFFPRADIRTFFQSVVAMAAGAATLKQIQGGGFLGLPGASWGFLGLPRFLVKRCAFFSTGNKALRRAHFAHWLSVFWTLTVAFFACQMVGSTQ